MADAQTVVAKSIRCPVCLFRMRRRKRVALTQQVRCSKCLSSFPLKDALPVKLSAATALRPRFRPILSLNQMTIAMLIMLGAGFGACIWTWRQAGEAKGLHFVVIYLLMVVVALFGQWVIRRLWDDRWLVSCLAWMLVELVGVTRLISGDRLGVEEIAIVMVIMVVGGAIQFLRGEHFQRSRRGYGFEGRDIGLFEGSLFGGDGFSGDDRNREDSED